MFSGKIEDYILFEDKEIIVCRKPSGIAVQNARIGAMDLESSLKNYLAMQDGGGRRIPYLAVIHRLDQPVEGILVFGKTPEAAKSLSAQITAGKMEKIYLAVTYGKQAEAGKKEKVLEDYLKKDFKKIFQWICKHTNDFSCCFLWNSACSQIIRLHFFCGAI